MNELKIFENSEFGKVRVKLVNGAPFFVGNDIAIILGYKYPSNAIQDHVDEEDKVIMQLSDIQDVDKMPHMKGSKVAMISESGVYSLIFGSTLNESKKFKKWVTSEVLSSIRKHGMYATPTTIDDMLNNPDFAIELLTKLKEERKSRIEAERKNAILTHVNKTYTATEVAKEIGMRSAIELNRKLAEKKVQFFVNGTWVLFAKYANLGYEDIKQDVLDNGKVIYHRKLTQLGRDFIINLFQNK